MSQSKEEDYEKNTVGSLPISNNQICNIQVWLTIPRIDLSDTDPFLTNLSPLWCPKPPSPNARNVHCNGWDFLFVPPVASADDQNFATLTKKHYISSLSQHVTRARRSKHVVRENQINYWVKTIFVVWIEIRENKEPRMGVAWYCIVLHALLLGAIVLIGMKYEL